MKKVRRKTLGAVHTHTHTHTGILLKNKKQQKITNKIRDGWLPYIIVEKLKEENMEGR